MEKCKNIPFEELSEIEQEQINQFICYYNQSKRNALSDYYIQRDFLGDSDENILLTRKDFKEIGDKEQSIKNLIERIEPGGHALLNMTLQLNENISLHKYIEKYESYINNLEVQLEGKEKKDFSSQEISDNISKILEEYVGEKREKLINYNVE